jgi:4-hydroxymandelate oxidase
VAVDIAELERRARRLLTPEVYDYYAGGSGSERTLRASVSAWQQHWLLPRVLRDVSAVDTSVRLPGLPETVAQTPVGVAPTGFQGLASPDGELATARGAAAAGALMIVSSRCSRRLEDIGKVTADGGGAWWFQVYVMRDRDLTARLVARAVAAGARALVLTADTPVVGHKRRNRGEELVTEAEFTANTGPLADLSVAEQAADLTFADIGWLARLGGVPVLVKGVLRADDARACVTAGAAAVMASNDGGGHLDGTVPTALCRPGGGEVAVPPQCSRTAGCAPRGRSWRRPRRPGGVPRSPVLRSRRRRRRCRDLLTGLTATWATRVWGGGAAGTAG